MPLFADPDQVMRMPELRQAIPLSETRLRQLITLGKFPRPVRLGARAVGWRAGDVRAYLEGLAKEDAERRAGLSKKRGPAPKSLTTQRATPA
ncbi:helix-turn-helix transcriptional regulator [Variovorax rhizosphaerae]|uniref:AlpA family phage regulatory protein n=1 Tax=Variovorax rhizosphaerae TaxID=1836200 RepID=A0ABU8WSQ4_9BURK